MKILNREIKLGSKNSEEEEGDFFLLFVIYEKCIFRQFSTIFYHIFIVIIFFLGFWQDFTNFKQLKAVTFGLFFCYFSIKIPEDFIGQKAEVDVETWTTDIIWPKISIVNPNYDIRRLNQIQKSKNHNIRPNIKTPKKNVECKDE